MKQVDEIALWEIEMAQAAQKLEEAKKYDNQGDIAWFEEKIRWAQHKIARLEAM